jgi:hypothetical protein
VNAFTLIALERQEQRKERELSFRRDQVSRLLALSLRFYRERVDGMKVRGEIAT